MRKHVLWFVAAATSLAMIGLIPVEGVSAVPGRGIDVIDPAGKQLLQARAATHQYRDIAKALKDGYANIDVFAPGQGCHYLNGDLLDGTFDPKRPELLMYAEAPGKDPRLIGVEYAVQISVSPQGPPEGFTGGYDVWSRNDAFGLWTLHAWVYLPNPDGAFADNNPLAPQTSKGCGTAGGGA